MEGIGILGSKGGCSPKIAKIGRANTGQTPRGAGSEAVGVVRVF